MVKRSSKERSAGMDPSEAPNAAPGNIKTRTDKEPEEGTYRNVETSVDNRESFNDEKEVREEDKKSEEKQDW